MKKKIIFSQYRAYGAYYDQFAYFIDDHCIVTVKLATPIHFNNCFDMLIKRKYFTREELMQMTHIFDQTLEHGTTQKIADVVSAAE